MFYSTKQKTNNNQRKVNKKSKEDIQERFSTFEIQDSEEEAFSDFELEEENKKGESKNIQQKVIEVKEEKVERVISKIQEDKKQELRFNYMEKVKRQLSEIKQIDENIYQSRFQPRMSKYSANSSRLDSSVFRSKDLQPLNVLLELERQRAKNMIIEQENKYLKQKIEVLEKSIYGKEYEIQKLKTQLNLNTKGENTSKLQQSPKQQQIAHLQSKCTMLNEEMEKYRKQCESLKQGTQKLLKQKERVDLQLKQLKQPSYEKKFISMFQDMTKKLPINYNENWTEKTTIAVGWRVVKYLVRKALRLGIILPNIIERND